MTRRTLQDWAHIAEIVAAIAVVVSLAYVAYELRENTRALVATSRQSLSAQDIAFISTALDSSVLARALAKSQAGEELSDLETSQLVERQNLNFRIFENAQYQYSIGSIDESEWARYQRLIGIVICSDRPAGDMWRSYKSSFTPDFQGIVDETLAGCSQ